MTTVRFRTVHQHETPVFPNRLPSASWLSSALYGVDALQLSGKVGATAINNPTSVAQNSSLESDKIAIVRQVDLNAGPDSE